MVAASRIVCALAALCGAASAAPSVTYDQRQHGEFNLQVEADGVAVVLLPGGSASDLFDRTHYHALTGGRLQQIFGRRHHGGDLSRKKKKKPEAQAGCTTAAAAQPEKPYTESPAGAGSPAATSPPRPVESSAPPYASESPATESSSAPPYVSESPAAQSRPEESASDVLEDLDVRLGTDDHRHHVIRPGTAVEDPYSVTPDTPHIFRRQGTDGYGEDDDVDDDPATATDSTAEQRPVEADRSSAADPATTSAPEGRPAADVTVSAKPSPAVAETDSGEKPATVSSPDGKTADKSTEDVARPAGAHADVRPQTDDWPAAVVVTKSESSTGQTFADEAKKPADEAKMSTDAAKKPADAAEKPADERPVAVEMIAMKTMEKPTVSEPLKVQAKNKQSSAEKPADMVVMKTIEKPTTAAVAADKSETAKPTEALPQGDAETGGRGEGPGEPVVSGSKPIEMVAVKTVESPGATTTVKSVVSVRTVIRPAGNPKTAAATVISSNGTSIMRKVGDRKPLPSITLEVSHPKVVV